MHPPYIALYAADFLADVTTLGNTELGIYWRLLLVYYQTREPLPQDRDKLIRTAMAFTPEETRALDYVIEQYFTGGVFGPDNRRVYRHARADREIAKATGRWEAAHSRGVVAGLASGESRRLRSQREKAAKRLATHSKEQWLALVEFCGNKCVRCGAEGRVEKDHIVPIYQGGSHGLDNVQPLCAVCNTSKGPERKDYRPDGWIDYVEHKLNTSSTNQNYNQNQKKPLGEVSPKTPLVEQARRILAHLNEKSGRNYRPGKVNLDLICNRLKEASEAECMAVVDCKARAWRYDAEMCDYLRPATLFNATKFAQYLGEIPNATDETVR